MQTYIVRRRGFATDATKLQAALSRLQAIEEAPSQLSVRWLHSYAIAEADGRYGLTCVLRADSPDHLPCHAEVAGLPATEILCVAATVLLRPIPTRSVYLLERRNAGIGARQEYEISANDHTHCLRTYVIHEADGACGNVSLYQSPLLATLAHHAARSGLVAEIASVIGRVVYRDET